MTDPLNSIRSKLDPQELTFLKDTFGVELRDPEMLAALSELNAATREMASIEEKFRIKAVSAEPPQCSFCGLTAHAVGPMAQATSRALICRACAIRCIAIIDEETKHA